VKHPEAPSWSIPKNTDWNILKVLEADEFLAPDNLLQTPSPNFVYHYQSRLKDPGKYDFAKQQKPVASDKVHPKLAYHMERGTATLAITNYYEGLPADRVLPIAGIIREAPDPRDSEVRDGPVAIELLGSSSVSPVFARRSTSSSSNTSSTLTGGGFPNETLDQTDHTRSHQGNSRRRLGERHKESAASSPAKCLPRQRHFK
jgi:hypothetical protein